MDRRLLSAQLQGSSKRSLFSESESEIGSLLSGLSQARKIPDRRRRHPGDNTTTNNGRNEKLSRSPPTAKSSARENGRPNSISISARVTSSRRERTDYKSNNKHHGNSNYKNNEAYRIHMPTIVKIQAFARGYITRFAYKSRLTMEKTKRRFFAIQIQANVRGFLERQRYAKLTGKKRTTTTSRKNPKPAVEDTGLGSPQQTNRRSRRGREYLNTATAKKPPPVTVHLESDSERSEVSLRLGRLMKNDRRGSIATADKLGDSASEAGSIRSYMSNLSVARKVPDRRRKLEQRENNGATKIQALARGYIQRFLYRSMLAMEDTKKKYAAIAIQARARGHLQRLNGPKVSRVHVAPRREPAPSKSKINERDRQTSNNRKTKKPKKKSDLLVSNKPMQSSRTKDNKAKKPIRHRSTADEHDNLLPRQLTIRKPRRQTSDTEEEESHEAPVRQLTIRQPRRHDSGSDGSKELAPKRVMVRSRNDGRGRRARNQAELSPPRKVMLRVKKPQRQGSDMDASEASLEPEKAEPVRRGRLMSLGASDSRFGESESDVGSLMSGLSQARKVPDRRLRNGPGAGGGRITPKRSNPSSARSSGKSDARTKSAIKIQALGRGYNARFAFKSKLIMEQTKKKFFAIQIQALARGYLARRKNKQAW